MLLVLMKNPMTALVGTNGYIKAEAVAWRRAPELGQEQRLQTHTASHPANECVMKIALTICVNTPLAVYV